MRQTISVLLMALGLLGLTMGDAHANKIVVPPLVARGTPAQTAANMTALIASELDLLDEFSEIDELSKRPSVLGPNCLGSTPCLKGIASLRGASTLLAGKVTKYGEEFEIALTYMSANRIVRTVKRRIATDPMAIADGLASLVRHAITGVDPEATAAEDRVTGFEGGALALMDDEEDEDDDDLLMAAPAVAVLPGNDPFGEDDLAEDPSQSRGGGAILGGAVLGAAAATAASSGGASGRGGVASGSRAASGGPAATSRAQAVPAPTAPPLEVAAEDIFFGSATTMIEVEAPAEDPVDPFGEDFYEAPVAAATVARQRQPHRRAPAMSDIRGTNTTTGGLQLIGRIGTARFQSLNFLTYGAEIAYSITPEISLIGGLEAYSTKRSIPTSQVAEGESTSFWNTLLPLKVGAVYRLGDNDLRPYVGADMQLIPGYVKSGGGMAFGFRTTGGADMMLSESFGLTAGVATGLWAGSNWYLIDGLMNTGFVVQVSTGAIGVF